MSQLRVYRARVSIGWWLAKRTYFVFVMRELSSIFIAWLVAYLLVFVYAVGSSASAYESFLDWADTPWVVVLNVIAAFFVVLHTVTWFNLTPQAMVVRMGSRRVPGWQIIAGQYVGLAVVSAFVIWLVTR